MLVKIAISPYSLGFATYTFLIRTHNPEFFSFPRLKL